MKCKLCCPGWGKKDCGNRILVIIFWLSILVELPCYVWTFLHVLKWSFGFNATDVLTAIWIHLFALNFGMTFSPMALFLTDWERAVQANRCLHCFLYIIGLGVGIALEVTSIIIISRYSEPNVIYDEWLMATKAKLKAGEYPKWLNDLGWPSEMEVDCCAWHGPLNIGATLTFADLRGPHKFIELTTMEQVAECYNDFFKTYQNYNETRLQFEPRVEMEELPVGCGIQIGNDLMEISYLIIISGFVQITLLVCSFLAYSYYPACYLNKLRRDYIRQNALYPAPHQVVPHPTLQPSEEDLPSSSNHSLEGKDGHHKIEINNNKEQKHIHHRRASTTIIPKRKAGNHEIVLIEGHKGHYNRHKSMPSYLVDRRDGTHDISSFP